MSFFNIFLQVLIKFNGNINWIMQNIFNRSQVVTCLITFPVEKEAYKDKRKGEEKKRKSDFQKIFISSS